MNPWHSKIDELWDYRCGGMLDKSRQLHADICSQLGINGFHEINNEKLAYYYNTLSAQSDPQTAISLLLVLLSLHRNSKDYDTAEKIAFWICELTDSKHLSPLPHLYIQIGLNYFAKSSFAKSLEFFLKARNIAQNDRDLALCEINSALCMDELGMEYAYHLEAAQKIMHNYPHAVWLEAYKSQANIIAIRQMFFTGNLSGINTELHKDKNNEQNLYFSAYLSKLPYLEIDTSSLDDEFQKSLSRNGFSYLTEFRLHTLRALSESDLAANKIKAFAWVERLYLWTWLYIHKPDISLANRITATLAQINSLASISISAAEYYMLSNSLDWISFFQPKLVGIAKSIISKCNSANANSPTFLLIEKKFILALKAKASASPLWQDELSSCNLLAQDEISQKIISYLNIRFNTEEKFPAEIILLSDDQSFIYNGKRTTSQQIFYLLQIFSSNIEFEKKEFAIKKIFGINNIDSLIHDPKLANLLSKANKLFSDELVFNSKGNHIYCTKLKNIKIHASFEHPAKTIFHDPNIIIPEISVHSSVENLINHNATENIYSNFSSRKSFELILGKSRATTARMLLAWKQKGLIETQGRGRAALYRAKPELKPFLTSNVKGSSHEIYN